MVPSKTGIPPLGDLSGLRQTVCHVPTSPPPPSLSPNSPCAGEERARGSGARFCSTDCLFLHEVRDLAPTPETWPPANMVALCDREPPPSPRNLFMTAPPTFGDPEARDMWPTGCLSLPPSSLFRGVRAKVWGKTFAARSWSIDSSSGVSGQTRCHSRSSGAVVGSPSVPNEVSNRAWFCLSVRLDGVFYCCGEDWGCKRWEQASIPGAACGYPRHPTRWSGIGSVRRDRGSVALVMSVFSTNGYKIGCDFHSPGQRQLERIRRTLNQHVDTSVQACKYWLLKWVLAGQRLLSATASCTKRNHASPCDCVTVRGSLMNDTGDTYVSHA